MQDAALGDYPRSTALRLLRNGIKPILGLNSLGSRLAVNWPTASGWLDLGMEARFPGGIPKA